MSDAAPRPGRTTVTVTETIHVERPPEVVFDYTQDYASRADWDPAISAARLVSEDPRVARIRGPGIGVYDLTYRLYRRPERTSAAFSGIRSSWLEGGGGSWTYEPRDGGTDWTQTNTLELKGRWVGPLLAPLVRRRLRDGMRAGMAAAKGILESDRLPSVG